ncbi:MAG: hypothetical protein GY847_01465 [Proteobacteria bacterium]|nr:hypothetical protein [Pseudomonadota bacterium]
MKSQTEKKTLHQIKAAIRRFEETQEKYSEYGATDTEPDAIFARLVRNAMSGRKANAPSSEAGWDLFKGIGATVAGIALGEAAKEVIALIKNAKCNQSEAMDYLRDMYGD